MNQPISPEQQILNDAVDKLTKLVELPERAELARAVLEEMGGYRDLAKQWKIVYDAANTTSAGKARMLDQLTTWIEEAKNQEESNERYVHMTKAQLLAKLKEFPFIEEYLANRDEFKRWLDAGKPGMVALEPEGRAQSPATDGGEQDQRPDGPGSEPGAAIP